MNRKKCISTLLALVMTLSLVSLSALADGTTLIIDAPDTLPAAGETFTVTVDISGNPGLCAAQYTLSFDKSVVQCTGVKVGTVLSGTLSATNESAADGAIVACASADAKTGDGVLSTYTFKVLSSGDADFALIDGVFTDADGKAIVTNVDQPAPPEPKTPTQPTTPTQSTQGTAAAQEQPDATTVDTAPLTDFIDMTSHWGEAYVQRAVELGLVTGNPDGTFAPDKPMTRAEFVTMLRRLSGDTAAAPNRGFSDVKAGDWFYDAVNWAAAKGYATGDGVKFNPNGNITRQEVVTILYRFHGVTGGMEAFVDGVLDANNAEDNMAGFSDAGSVSSWAADAMHWAIRKGLMNGKSTTTLAPLDSASRAEITAIFVRYAEK